MKERPMTLLEEIDLLQILRYQKYIVMDDLCDDIQLLSWELKWAKFLYYCQTGEIYD